jgi:hypothetical protein
MPLYQLQLLDKLNENRIFYELRRGEYLENGVTSFQVPFLYLSGNNFYTPIALFPKQAPTHTASSGLQLEVPKARVGAAEVNGICPCWEQKSSSPTITVH